MSIEPQQLLHTVYDVIYDSLTTPPPLPGAVAPLAAATNVLTMAFPGIPVDAAQFVNPWSPLNPGGLMSAAECFALLVDAAPALSPVYTPNGLSIDTLYGQVVHANLPAPPPLRLNATRVTPTAPSTPASARLLPLAARKKELAEASDAYRKAFDVLYTPGKDFDRAKRPIDAFVRSARYSKHLEKKMQYSAASAQFMAGQLLKQRSRRQPVRAPAAAPASLQATFKALSDADGQHVEAALRARSSEPRSSVAAIFDAAASLYELTTQGSVLLPGLEWHWCEAFPANWFSDAAAAMFAGVQVSQESTYVNEGSRLAASPGFDALVDGLFAHRDGGDWSRESMSRTTERLTVAFKFMRVEIRRRWLDPSLLTLAGWSIPGRPQNALSNGSLTANPGLLPILTTSMILARDVTISAQWSREDRELIEAGAAGKDVAFGPFPLGGDYRLRGAQKRLKSEFDGTTITVPGLQVLGFIGSLVPACPPCAG